MATIFLLVLLTGCQTIMAQDWTASVTAKINGPTADQVWPYMADFCNVYKTYPSDVSFCVSGEQGKPGLTRYIVEKHPSPTNPKDNVILWNMEELVEFNPNERSETHVIRANNKGLTKFTATVQILPADHGCTFKWSVVSAPIPGVSYDDFVNQLNQILSGVVSLIEKLF